MTMHVFVDADHAGDLVTRRLRTGFIVFLNKAPTYGAKRNKTPVKQALLEVNSLL